jgi:hypothetical protein
MENDRPLKHDVNTSTYVNPINTSAHRHISTLNFVVYSFADLTKTHMKTSLTLLLFCCTFSSFYCQDYPCDPNARTNKCGQWELGVNLFSFQHEETNRDKFILIPAYTSGIILKKHCNRHAWRFALDRFDYSHFEKTYDGIKPRWWYEANYHTIKHELRFGWEYAISKNKIQPFVALDMVLANMKINSHSVGEGDIEPGIFYYQYTRTRRQVGLASTLGLKYLINERISLSTETNVGFNYEQINSPAYDKDYYDRSDTFYHLLRSFAVHYKF